MYRVIEQYIDRLITESTKDRFIWNIEKIHNNKQMNWNYVDGCMFNSLLELYEQTKNKKYLDFVINCIDNFVTEDGNIKTFQIEEYSLDNICESRVLFKLYEITKKTKYLEAIKLTYQQIIKQPRTKENNFWHKLIYPQQVWLDGFYMVMPFYLKYLNRITDTNEQKIGYQDIFNQYQNAYLYMHDNKTNLYYHGYDSSKTMFWADPITGLSKNFWLRSLGWYIVSLVEVYEEFPLETVKIQMAKWINDLIKGLLTYQDPHTKMFYQIINMPNLDKNYVETSGSAMIAYAILKASRLGIISKDYQQIGLEIFNGICKYQLLYDNNQLTLKSICLSAGLGPNNRPNRDGSIEYYLSEPIVENDAKGTAPFIMAYIEARRLISC